MSGPFDVEVTLDFSAGLNVRLDNDLLHACELVGPNSTKVVATLLAYDTDWNTACHLKLVKRPAIARGPRHDHELNEAKIDQDFPPTANSVMPGIFHDNSI